MAKIQAGNTWELSAVPYIPALENVAQHAANLRAAHVDGVMSGWTLGGFPSLNLAVVSRILDDRSTSPVPPEQALRELAEERFGKTAAPAVLRSWHVCSQAFREFPFDGGVVYNAPLQSGPSNLLWPKPTGYAATMVGFPYDHLDAWRGPYPAEIFIQQMEKVAAGFESACALLESSAAQSSSDLRPAEHLALRRELGVTRAAAIHFRSVAHQARFVLQRQLLATLPPGPEALGLLDQIESLLRHEIKLAESLWELQRADSRIGFEASNQYYYVPQDLIEKAANCQHLLETWLPAAR